MLKYLINLQTRGTEWFKHRSHGAYAKAWLFFLSFTESSFLFIPPDILLVAILLASSRQWFYYAALTTIASILGAVFGYAISAFFFDVVGIKIINFYNLDEYVEIVRVMFNNNSFWVIFTSAFTPIPYKVFVLAAGFLKINFFIFLMASIIGRSLRYFFVAYIVHVFGERATRLLSRYSISLTIGIIVIFIIFVIKNIFF